MIHGKFSIHGATACMEGLGVARVTATLYCEEGDVDYSSLNSSLMTEETENDKELNLKESVFLVVHPIIRKQEKKIDEKTGLYEYGDIGEIEQVTHLVLRFDY